MRKRYRLHLRGHEQLDRWLVSYADYMTLIFALFVVLYSVAMVDKDKYRAVIEGMTQAFEGRPLQGEGLLEREGPAILPPAGASGKPLLAETAQAQASALAPISGVPIAQEGEPLAELDDRLRKALAPLQDAGLIDIKRDEEWLNIALDSALLFSSGSAFMGPNASPLLNSLSSILKPVDNYVRVRGYTDNQQIHNEIFSSNWALSAARAEAVLGALIAEGVRPERLAFEAYGEFSPFASNETEAGRAKNRQVVVAISRLRWVAPVAPTPEPVMARREAAAPRPDAQDINVIALPGGGIRITTRQD
ncbi:OmpA family protein [Aeromonas sobria]|uniref:OmpA family protein n=1 Tax=Aeromonas sobria TaxID=646 RepID=UPI003D04EF83